MAFTEFDMSEITSALDAFMTRRRPPPHLRAQLDLRYRVTGHSIEIFEVRPAWRDPSTIQETPCAKTIFVRTRNVWRLYWMRQDLKWHRYGEVPDATGLIELLRVIDDDAYGCFFG